MSWHVHVERQSLSAAHDIGVIWHTLTGVSGQPHEASDSDVIGAAASESDSTMLPSEASIGTLSALPPSPAFELAHAHGSGTQVNPEPQSEAT